MSVEFLLAFLLFARSTVFELLNKFVLLSRFHHCLLWFQCLHYGCGRVQQAEALTACRHMQSVAALGHT